MEVKRELRECTADIGRVAMAQMCQLEREPNVLVGSLFVLADRIEFLGNSIQGF